MSEMCHSILMDSRGRAVAQIASVCCDFKNGKVIPEHFHPEHQLVFASSGVMTVHTGQNVWVVPPMRAVWIPALTPHRIVMSGLVSMRTLYFLPQMGPLAPQKVFHDECIATAPGVDSARLDRKSTRLNSSHLGISYAVFCLKKK